MPRARTPSEEQPLPPPLPPETRTVGQLVAEAIQLYRRRFWRSLALGLGPAVLGAVASGLERRAWLVVMTTLGAVLLSLSYVGACALAADARLRSRAAVRAFAVAVAVFVPFPFLILVFVLPGLAWLALLGLAVPAALIEDRGLLDSCRRAVRLATADFVHALGSLATLVIVVFLVQGVLVFLLRGTGEQTLGGAVFLATLVLSPLVFLGSALLYFDQAARVVDSPSRSRRRRR